MLRFILIFSFFVFAMWVFMALLSLFFVFKI